MSAEDGVGMDYTFEKHMGVNIRNIRESKGLTQEQLAARLQSNGCDLTRSALAKIEVGQRHIYPFEIKVIKEVLLISYDALFN